MLANSPSLAPSPVKSKRSTAMPCSLRPSAMRRAAWLSLPQVKQCANSAMARTGPSGRSSSAASCWPWALRKSNFSAGIGASYLSAPSPRARGEGRDEGALTDAQTCGAQNRGEAPSPAALRADDLSPRGGERQIECLPTVSASPRQTQRRAALADSPSIVRPWPGCAKRSPARAHEPVTDLSHLAGASAEARIQFMNAGDRGDRQ